MMRAYGEPGAVPPFEVLDIDAADLDRYPDLLRDISDSKITVALIRNVFPMEAAAQLVARVEAGEGSARLTEVAPKFHIYSLGLALDTAESLEQYLSEAEKFLPDCREIFRDLIDYFEWLPSVLKRISGGRPVEIPSLEGRGYNPVTIRKLPEGGNIPPHCESEQFNRPAYTHLKKLVGTSPIVSFFTTLRPPGKGGQIRVSKMAWGDVEISADGRSNAASVIDNFESMTFLPNCGDMIVFNGGINYHQVIPIGGAQPRWTIGAFMCESADRERVLYWS